MVGDHLQRDSTHQPLTHDQAKLSHLLSAYSCLSQRTHFSLCPMIVVSMGLVCETNFHASLVCACVCLLMCVHVCVVTLCVCVCVCVCARAVYSPSDNTLGLCRNITVD